uniref:Uncharacterized protein n=1 Tax=Anopheles minimus TaxID=112268 RepID=A0A182WHN5_9DIPT
MYRPSQTPHLALSMTWTEKFVQMSSSRTAPKTGEQQLRSAQTIERRQNTRDGPTCARLNPCGPRRRPAPGDDARRCYDDTRNPAAPPSDMLNAELETRRIGQPQASRHAYTPGEGVGGYDPDLGPALVPPDH